MKNSFSYAAVTLSTGSILALLVVSSPAAARENFSPMPPETSRAVPGRNNPKAVLKQAQHSDRLVRVRGIIGGMARKLDNLSQRLDRQLEAVNKHLAALRAAGHKLSVDIELGALQQAIATAQDLIAETRAAITAIPDSETPRQQTAKAREQLRALRPQIKAVRDAFKSLRQAISIDVRSSPKPDVSQTP